MALTARNVTGSPATFEEALHSYFAVSDVRQVRDPTASKARRYVDKTAAMARKPGDAGPIAIVSRKPTASTSGPNRQR